MPTEQSMDEARRRAYLEAMGVPVWLSRERDPVTPATESTVTEEPVARRRGSTGSRAALKQLLDSGAGGQGASKPPGRPAVASKPVERTAAQGSDKISWTLVRLGDLLLIDEVPAGGAEDRLGGFYGNLQIAVTGRREPALVEEFRWPPEAGPDLDQALLPDALAGRLEALHGKRRLRSVLLLGDAVAAAFEASGVAARIACPVSRHSCAAHIMRSAEAKRSLWAALSSADRG